MGNSPRTRVPRPPCPTAAHPAGQKSAPISRSDRGTPGHPTARGPDLQIRSPCPDFADNPPDIAAEFKDIATEFMDFVTEFRDFAAVLTGKNHFARGKNDFPRGFWRFPTQKRQNRPVFGPVPIQEGWIADQTGLDLGGANLGGISHPPSFARSPGIRDETELHVSGLKPALTSRTAPAGNRQRQAPQSSLASDPPPTRSGPADLSLRARSPPLPRAGRSLSW
jgi:hypothetical protein